MTFLKDLVLTDLCWLLMKKAQALIKLSAVMARMQVKPLVKENITFFRSYISTIYALEARIVQM